MFEPNNKTRDLNHEVLDYSVESTILETDRFAT